jgi:hypothetical protein
MALRLTASVLEGLHHLRCRWRLLLLQYVWMIVQQVVPSLGPSVFCVLDCTNYYLQRRFRCCYCRCYTGPGGQEVAACRYLGDPALHLGFTCLCLDVVEEFCRVR